MKINILNKVTKALDLFDNSKKDEAIKLLNTFLQNTKKADSNQKEYDLAMETYFFYAMEI